MKDIAVDIADHVVKGTFCRFPHFKNNLKSSEINKAFERMWRNNC